LSTLGIRSLFFVVFHISRLTEEERSQEGSEMEGKEAKKANGRSNR
jgi:hypothetical protein